MKILHITDFHYDPAPEKEYDQKRLIKSMVESLKDEGDIEFVFFTGDLVNRGNEAFFKAQNILLDVVSEELNIKKYNIFLCQGNHDINRLNELGAIRDTFEKITNNKGLNQIYSEKERLYHESIKNHEKFIEFHKSFLYEDDEHTALSSLHKRRSGQKKIGIATMNSSWRSFDSKTDTGNLLFPSAIIKEQSLNLEGADLKILLCHHPLTDFKKFNANELEDLIYENFDLLVSGHTHRKKQSTQITSNTGILCCESPSTFSIEDKDNEIGYTLLNIDVEDLAVIIQNRIYLNKEAKFVEASKISVSIPLESDKKQQNEFRKILRLKYEAELEASDDLLVNNFDQESNNSFLELFTTPIIKKSPDSDYKQNPLDDSISINELTTTQNSYIIFGKSKSGKTSILRMIQLVLLNDINSFETIPFYIDFKAYESKKKSLDLTKTIAQYFHVNIKTAEKLIKTYNVKLLIDNYDPTVEILYNSLAEFFQKYSNSSFIAVTEDSLTKHYESIKIVGINHSDLFIHSITRKEVRELANKWPNLSVEKVDAILNKVGSLFIQLNIPVNYWTVSLLIWIHEKNSNANFQNDVDLLNLYIDSLLERNSIALSKTKITYEDYKTFISHLAHFLLINYYKNDYSASYNDLVNFTQKYYNENVRFNIAVEDILGQLVSRGILKRKSSERYCFRLKGVFEYFLAYYMREDEEFRKQIIDDDGWYLSFSNELELCSGFLRNNVDYLNQIFTKTKSLYNTINSKYKLEGSIDENLNRRISDAYNITSSLKSIDPSKLALSESQSDEILSELKPLDVQDAEVERKKFYDSIEVNPENLERSLFILSRVFRNSTVKNEKLLDEILDYILVSACSLGNFLIDEIGQIKNEDNIDHKEAQIILRLMSSFMPIFVQTFLFDSMAQINLERIIDKKIDSLLPNLKENQFVILILYLIQIDLDLKNKKDLLDEINGKVNIGVLNQTILIKLYFYIAFKCNNDYDLENSLINKLEKFHLKIDSRFDIVSFRRNMSKKKKKRKLQIKTQN